MIKKSGGKTKDGGVSIIVPVYNEERNIRPAITNLTKALTGKISDFEIIIVDDGSIDGTGIISDQINKTNNKIRVMHLPGNKGFGEALKAGIKGARKEYITQFHGDNDTSADSIVDMIKKREEADLIMAYTKNTQARSWKRRIVSKSFVVFMNLLFGMNLRYFNGCFICKTDLLQSVSLRSHGLAIYSEIKVRLLKRGISYKEVPFTHTKRKFGRSKAVSIKSMVDTLNTVAHLVVDT